MSHWDNISINVTLVNPPAHVRDMLKKLVLCYANAMAYHIDNKALFDHKFFESERWYRALNGNARNWDGWTKDNSVWPEDDQGNIVLKASWENKTGLHDEASFLDWLAPYHDPESPAEIIDITDHSHDTYHIHSIGPDNKVTSTRYWGDTFYGPLTTDEAWDLERGEYRDNYNESMIWGN